MLQKKYVTHTTQQQKHNLFRLIALQPLLLRDWELRVQFKIHGQAKKNLNGDGLAIWLTRDRMKNGESVMKCSSIVF